MIFVIRDWYTGIIQAYPSARQDTDAVIRAVVQALKIPMEQSAKGRVQKACKPIRATYVQGNFP